jgi:AcrR family transcriptional regulator
MICIVEHCSTELENTLSSEPVSSAIPPGIQRLREQHGAVTRRTILQAARTVFAEQGYAATPIRLLARRAGVAVQTIYDTFGSKAGVLRGMPDLIDEEAGVFELVAALERAESPEEALQLYARLRRQIRERCGDVVAILRSGAVVETEIAAVLAEGTRRRRFGLRHLIERLSEAGALKEDLSVERATDIASALVTDEVCDVLVDQGGWSYDDYEAWTARTLVTLLLRNS